MKAASDRHLKRVNVRLGVLRSFSKISDEEVLDLGSIRPTRRTWRSLSMVDLAQRPTNSEKYNAGKAVSGRTLPETVRN